jgi:hypothetical protein
MAQTILNFTVENTNEKLTPRVGEAVVGEFLKTIKIDQCCNRYLSSYKVIEDMILILSFNHYF